MSEASHSSVGVRSALQNLPSFPRIKNTLPPPLARVPKELRSSVLRLTNGAIRGFQALARGDTVEGDFEYGSRSGWNRSSPLGKDASVEILEGVVSDWESNDALAMENPADAALRDRLAYKAVMKGAEGYSRLNQSADGLAALDAEGREILPKGTVADGPLEELGLPPPGFSPIPAESLSEEVAFRFQNFQKLTLRRPEKVDWTKFNSIQGYWSPTYQSKEARLGLALRMYQCGMLAAVQVALSCISMFTVVKSYAEDGARSLRPVWDQRGPNLV